MNAVETEMNNIIAVAEEVINVEAQILETDYEGDQSAEFYCQYLNTMNYFESFIEDPETLCLPDEDGEIPYVVFMEMMRDLTGYKWAKRTYNRMNARTTGIEPAERLTQLEKAEHPEYKNWLCLKCLQFYKGEKQLKKHQLRSICQERNAGLFIRALKNKLPDAKFYHTALVLNDLVARAQLYKKNIEPELDEEEFEEEEEDSESEEEYEDKFERQLLKDKILKDETEEKDFDEYGFCKYCNWNSCYQQSHIEYCGYGNCEYIKKKYGELELKRMFEEEYGDTGVKQELLTEDETLRALFIISNNLTKDMALYTMKTLHPHIYDVVNKDWDKYYNLYLKSDKDWDKLKRI